MTEKNRLLRAKQVVERLPISISTWWAGVKAGKYPQPLKLGPKTTVWRESDIDAIVEGGLVSRGGKGSRCANIELKDDGELVVVLPVAADDDEHAAVMTAVGKMIRRSQPVLQVER